MNKTVLKVVGVVGVVVGTVALVLAGEGIGSITAIVEAVVVLAGLIAVIFGFVKKDEAK